jgi:hypothetical protein
VVGPLGYINRVARDDPDTASCGIRGGKISPGETISRSKPTLAFHCQSLFSIIVSGPASLCIQ